MAIDMRHSKLKPEEAALLAGELKKPNWQSKNEGIHERVSFEDTIWGFDLAGGSYYQTPLRVVGVKKGSRAEKAGIRLGDKLKRINDIDTSTLTIQEAHEIIVESGVHLKIAVSAPEDEEDAYFCYEDQLESGYDSDEERRRLEEKIKKRQIHAKVSSYWSLQWPWVSKRRVIYRESNCFMVPSKFESKHKEKFPSQPFLRVEDDVVLQKAKNAKILEEAGILNDSTENNLTNGDTQNDETKSVQNGNSENSSENINNEKTAITQDEIDQDTNKTFNGNLNETSDFENKKMSNDESIKQSDSNEIPEQISNIKTENSIDKIEESTIDEDIVNDKVKEENEEAAHKTTEEPHIDDYFSHDEVTEETEDKTSTINDETSTMNDEDIISQEDEVIKSLADDGDLSTEDDRLLDSILSDGGDSRRNNDESER